MKNIFVPVMAIAGLMMAGCNDAAEGEYVDLETGEKITVEKSKEKGYMVNTKTDRAVYLYVDPVKKDTFYGRTGRKVNNDIVSTGGTYRYEGDGDYVYKNGDYKLKTEADGEMKLKDGDYKMKVDDDGDMKVKDGDDYKKKVEADGDMKIKDGNTKIKVEDGEVEVKRKD